MARKDPMLGILLPLVGDELAAKGSGTFESAYTEAGPLPGLDGGDRLWKLVVSGTQTQPIDFLVTDAGYPERGQGMKIAVRATPTGVSVPSDTSWQSWDEPILISGVTSPSDYVAEPWDTFCAAKRSDNGVIVIVALVDGDPTAARAWSFNPRTEAWTPGYDFGASQGLESPICMIEDPDVPGRMLLWSGYSATPYSRDTVAYFSDDNGATWQLFAVGLFDTASYNADRPGIAAIPGQDWLMFTAGPVGFARQWYSSNHGVTWNTIGTHNYTDTSTPSHRYSIVAGPKGYVVSYLTNTDQYPAVRIIPSAQTSLADAEEITIQETGFESASDDVHLTLDDDGTIYATIFDDGGGGTGGKMTMYRSEDGGYTWRRYTRGMHGVNGVDVDALYASCGVFSLGKLHIVGSDFAGDGLFIFECGGWSNVEQGMYLATTNIRADRFGWLFHTAGGAGVTFTPLDTLTGMGFTVASTSTETQANGGANISSNAGQTYAASFALSAATAQTHVSGAARVKVLTGVDRATTTIFLGMRIQDAAATGYIMRIYLGTNGIEVRDGAATVRASQAIADMTIPLDIRWSLRQTGGIGRGTVWTRQVGSGGAWTRVANDVTLTSTAIGNTAINFSHDAPAATINSVLMFLAGAIGCDWRHGLDDAADVNLLPVNGVRGLSFGRPVGPVGVRYPVPLLGTTGDDQGFVHAFGGPAYLGEGGDVAVGYRWPIDAIRPEVQPSPRLGWRATDTSLVDLVYDAVLPRWRGGALALCVQLGSFRTAELWIDDGAGGWTNLATLDKGQNCDYTLNGKEVRPSGADLSRYVARDELAGGYFVLETGGGVGLVARRIVSNSPGYWSVTTVQQIRLELEGVDGTEDATGSGGVVHPSGVMFFYPSADTARRYIRIRIPAGQVVPADRGEDGATAAYDAGVLFVAAVIGIGTEPDWQTTRRVELPAIVSRRRDGSPSIERTGVARKTWAYAWGPSAARKMRLIASAPSYIAVAGGAPIGTWQDAWAELVRVLDQADGHPLVVVARLPLGNTQTYTDSSAWIYGEAMSPAIESTMAPGSRELVADLPSATMLVVEELP